MVNPQVTLSLNSIVIVLLWNEIFQFVSCEEFIYESAFSRTAEVRFYQHRKYTWEEVGKFCGDLDMHVLVLYNIETFAAVEKYMKQPNEFKKAGYWHGRNDLKTEKTYVNYDGSVGKTYFTWHPDYFSESSNRDCVTIRTTDAGGQIFDQICEESEFYAACSHRIGKPKLISVEEKPCLLALEVKWIPHNRSVGVKHRFNAVSTKHEHSATLDVVPIGNGTQTTLFRGLRIGLQYDIHLTVCTDDCCCGTVYDSIKTSILTSTEIAVSKPYLVSESSGACSLIWSNPAYASLHAITSNRITLTSSPAHLGDVTEETIDKQEIIIVGVVRTFNFYPESNRKYIGMVQAGTCGGFAKERAIAPSTCRAKHYASLYAPNPTLLFLPGKKVLLVTKPDDSVSPMSCLFVVVHPYLPDEQLETSMESVIDEAYIRAASKNLPGTDAPYVAVAVPSSHFTNGFMEIELGNGLESQCNTAVLNEKMGNEASYATGQGKETTFQGQNWRLKPEWTYSVFLATSSLGDGGLNAFSRSASCEITADIVNEHISESAAAEAAARCGSGSTVAAAIIAALDMLVGGVIGFLIMKKRKSSSDTSEDSEEKEKTAGGDGVNEEKETKDDKHKEKKKKKKDKDKDKDEASSKGKDSGEKKKKKKKKE